MKGLTKVKDYATIDQTRPDQLIVSFCVPVYNNAEAAERIVRGILCSDSTRFEVIVSDDASTDDCEERLSRIQDSRFRYYRNEKNLGAHKNWEHALELGRGEYLFLSMGRDRLHGEGINRLVEILEYAHENNITLLEDGHSDKDEIKIYDGIDAMIFFLKITHPTGTIFNRRIFEAIPNRTRYFEIADMYPENYVKRDMLLKGKGASIMSGTYDVIKRDYDWSKPSTVEYGKNIYDMYYAPRRTTIQNFEIIDMLPDTFSESDFNKFFSVKFTAILNAASFEWRSWCDGDDPYYGQKAKKVGSLEMIQNIFTACHDTVEHLKEKGVYTHSKQLVIWKVIVKIFMRFFLEPIGIWGVLYKLKHRYFPR